MAPPPDPPVKAGGLWVGFALLPRYVPDRLVELGELAVDVVHRYVRLAQKRHDLVGDVLDGPFGCGEDPGEPQEHPREYEERYRDPREEYPFHQLNESVQALSTPPARRTAL